MDVSLIPKTLLGKITGIAAFIHIVIIVISALLSRSLSIDTGVAVLDPSLSPALAALGALSVALGVFTFFLGLICLARKDYSIIVLCSTLTGVFAVFFLIGERLMQ